MVANGGRFERRIGRQKPRAYSGIVEKRLADAGSDFLEMNNVGRLRSLQDVIQDELGACDGLRLGGLDIPRCEGEALLADGVCWMRRRRLGDWVMRVAQRYGCPAIGGMVEGRKSTLESVEEHRGAALGSSEVQTRTLRS
jgi:hypothetical protein